ncbi:hypothetical protein SUDANB121_01667 [Nocardiopsis dassonvillei]|uniref:hypothetical protein n=1 Tax=Nocardiopsis dassonvillei TaxID=2014 RepID=UPI003F5773C2
MARYRYLNCSELVAARWPTSEALRWRRPHRASRTRMYVTHPGRDLAPLTLAVRQWISHTAPPQAPTPAPVKPAPPLPRRVGNTGSTARSRVPAPRTSPDQRPEPPTALAAHPASPPDPVAAPAPSSAPPPEPVAAPIPAPTPIADAVAHAVPDSGFTAALASRPRVQALREGARSRTRSGSSTAESRAAARLRARTAAFRRTTRMTADRDGLWKDAMAAARILKRDLGRAA